MIKARILDGLVICAIVYFVALAPYTKVEESFNIQAVHDILNYGFFPYKVIHENYDHVSFPGAVPRSFVGSLVLAAITKVIVVPLQYFGVNFTNSDSAQLPLQRLVRVVLGLANGLMLIRFKDQMNSVAFVEKKHKRGVIGFWFLLLLLSQFHLLFYSSRTLPNFIALPVVNFALGRLISGDITGLAWLAFVGITLRLEVGLFGGIIAIVSSLGFGQYSLSFCTFLLISGTLAGLAVSFAVDSYFWGRLCIPEFEAFFFNVIEGKSSQWGTLPFPTYFTELLWKLFRPPIVLLLIPSSLLTDPADDGSDPFNNKSKSDIHPSRNTLRILTTSSLLYILLMSFQPHKEWRFIIYTAPIFIMLAANALASFQRQTYKGLAYKGLVFLLFVGTCSGVVLSFLMGFVSSFNYPGGDVIQYTNQYMLEHGGFAHLDIEPCMTGITKFTQSTEIKYDKTEDPEELAKIWGEFSIFVTEKRLTSKPYDNGHITFDGASWLFLYAAKKFETINLHPLIFLIQQNQKDNSVLPAMLLQLFSELTKGHFDTFKNLLNAMIAQTDYIYVYKRIKADSFVPIINYIPQVQDQEPEVDFQKVEDDLNHEIDELEGVHTN